MKTCGGIASRKFRSRMAVIKLRGTAEQWVKEGKNGVQWTKHSCRKFKDNKTRLQIFALAYNLGNFLRRLALPKAVRNGSSRAVRPFFLNPFRTMIYKRKSLI